MLAHNIQAPQNNPKERIQYSQQGKSLKSRMLEKFHHLIISNELELIYGTVRANPETF
jgi:hypothetical protein